MLLTNGDIRPQSGELLAWATWLGGGHLEDLEDALFEDGTTGTVPRLREGIERFFITDINSPAGSAKAQSTVPVMWDTFMTYSLYFQATLDAVAPPLGADYLAGKNNVSAYSNHLPGGSNVLFMDGHVEFHKYDTDGDGSIVWPMSRDAIDGGGYNT